VVAADPQTRQLLGLVTRSLERQLGEPLEFVEAADGEAGVHVALRERPDVVVADEIISRAGAFSLAHDLRGLTQPYRGVIVIVLDRPHDAWLARWSGADAWFVKPVDAFAMADIILELVRASRGMAPLAERAGAG
jgi:two-component system, OmpR family, response regulator VicR